MHKLHTDNSRSQFTRLIEHARIPLFRNGYSLVFSTVATSGLGMLYWILAARLYPTEVVGLNTAVLSVVIFLANLAQLNQINALNRFLPAAGRSSPRYIGLTYMISAGLGLLAGLIFLLGINFWAPSLGFLSANPLLGLAFTAGVILWVLFVLQDGALTGLRQAVWVPAKNVAVSVVKIILLVAFASLLPSMGVLASWLVPMTIALFVMNSILFRRLVPEHVRLQGDKSRPVHPRLVAQYITGDFLSSLFWIALVDLQPVIVVERLGPSANAYFFLPWQVAYSLFLVSRSMGMSLLTEVSLTPSRLNDYSFRILKQTGRIVLPAVAVIVIGAPYLLWLFGREYVQEGTVLLRLLTLSTLPHMVIVVYMSMARAQNHIRQLILVQASHSILTLALLNFLIGPFGVTGIGMAWLVGQSVVALILLATGLRRVIITQMDLGLINRIYSRARSMVWQRQERRQVDEISKLIPGVLAAVPSESHEPWMDDAYAQKILHTLTEVTVVILAQGNQKQAALLKLAETTTAEESLRRQKEALAALHSDPRLNRFHHLLPKLLADGEVDGKYYQIEEMLPGQDAHKIIEETGNSTQVLETAAQAIAGLHQATAKQVTIDQRFLKRWVDDRFSLVQESLPGKSPLVHQYLGSMTRAADEIYAALEGKHIPISWIHGDYSPANILLTPDAKTVLGIVDWDQAARDELPALDLVQFILATRIQNHRLELGEVLCGLLGGEALNPTERAMLDQSFADLHSDPLNLRALLLLTWLRHVTANLTKSTRYAGHWLWLTKNVEAVFDNV